jgi:group I intron endonuclease
MTSISAIYVILNKKNGKVYIGSAYNLKKRWYEHRHYLNKSCHQNPHLQAAWNKYGAKEFQFKVLEYCAIDQLKDREQHYLDIYMPKGMCYNIALDAVAPMRGRKITEETRRKRSKALKGRILSDEHRRKIGDANKGGSGSKGRIVTEETRLKISESHKHRQPISAETKQKISDSLKGRKQPPRSEAHRQKISENNKNRPPMSDEIKRKMSEAQKLRWARKRAILNDGDES